MIPQSIRSPARRDGKGSSGQRPEERQDRQGGRSQGQAGLYSRVPDCLEQPDHRSPGQAQRQYDGQSTRNPRPPNKEGHGQRSGRAKAIRFSTLEAICRVLQCQTADLLKYQPEPTPLETISRPVATVVTRPQG